MSDETTNYGFKWGVATVTRLTEFRGTKVMGVDTPHKHLEVSVSPTGRSVRVWLDGRELEPADEPTHEQQMEVFGEMG